MHCSSMNGNADSGTLPHVHGMILRIQTTCQRILHFVGNHPITCTNLGVEYRRPPRPKFPRRSKFHRVGVASGRVWSASPRQKEHSALPSQSPVDPKLPRMRWSETRHEFCPPDNSKAYVPGANSSELNERPQRHRSALPVPAVQRRSRSFQNHDFATPALPIRCPHKTPCLGLQKWSVAAVPSTAGYRHSCNLLRNRGRNIPLQMIPIQDSQGPMPHSSQLQT